MFSLKDIIEMAIQIEKNGEKVYRKVLEEVSNLSLVSLLQHLADEEAQHVQWFAELEQPGDTVVDDPRVEKAGRAILQEILGDQTFSLADADFSHKEDVEALLSTAMEFEKDTALFYEMIRSFVQNQDVVRQLDTIIEQEYQHARDLEQFLGDAVSKGTRKD
jgi:rubrerythrin